MLLHLRHKGAHNAAALALITVHMLWQTGHKGIDLILLHELPKAGKICLECRAPHCLNALRRQPEKVTDCNPDRRITEIE